MIRALIIALTQKRGGEKTRHLTDSATCQVPLSVFIKKLPLVPIT
jgi:hypothetical protein